MISKLTSVSAKRLTSSGKITDTGAEIHAITLAAGSAAATVTIHDSEDNSGDVVWDLSALTNDSASISFPHPISLSSGAYATISGTGATVSIAYGG